MGNPVGRPRTTLKDIPEDWVNIMVDIAQQGGSKVEAMANLGISKTGWQTLCDDYPEEFNATVERCDILCQQWWEKQGRRMTEDGKGSAVVWKFNMQNRFNWREKVESDNTSSDGSMTPAKLSDDDLQAELAKYGLKPENT